MQVKLTEEQRASASIAAVEMSNAFVFYDTPEGHDYWAGICDRLRAMATHGTTDGKPWQEPIRVPTDEDARQRPTVLVRDSDDQEWIEQTLVFVDRRSGHGYTFMAVAANGSYEWFRQCKFPDAPPDNAAASETESTAEESRLIDRLASMPTTSTAHMSHQERADGIKQMMIDLNTLATNDGCIAAAWAAEFIREVVASKTETNAAASEAPENGIEDGIIADGDWLESVGFTPSGRCNTWTITDSDIGNITINVRGEARIVLRGYPQGMTAKPITRGGVRRLCRVVLGVDIGDEKNHQKI